MEVGLGDPGELLGPTAVELKIDQIGVIFAAVGIGVVDVGAGYQNLFLQQQGNPFQPPGIIVDLLFDIDLIVRRDLVGQA